MTDRTGVLYRAAFVGSEGGGELKEVELASLEEALRAACRDLRAGYAPIGIWTAERLLLRSAAAIRENCRHAGATQSPVHTSELQASPVPPAETAEESPGPDEAGGAQPRRRLVRRPVARQERTGEEG